MSTMTMSIHRVTKITLVRDAADRQWRTLTIDFEDYQGAPLTFEVNIFNADGVRDLPLIEPAEEMAQ